jgi:2-polyprenyl-3-methyl-5-hydroxy-6-metoxy-1,4-benzoquinol methylase
MEKYKSEIYEKYSDTHLLWRKSNLLDDYNKYCKYYDKNYSIYLPESRIDKIIEFGCGSGKFLYFLKKKGFRNIIGLDLDKKQITFANEFNISEAKYGDFVNQIEIENEMYDRIIFLDVLEHFKKNEVIDILKKCKNLLSLSGKIIIHVPNAESLFSSKILYGDITHEIAFTQTSLMQIGKLIGFDKIEITEDKKVFFGIKGFVLNILWKFVKGILSIMFYAESGKKNFIQSSNLICVFSK